MPPSLNSAERRLLTFLLDRQGPAPYLNERQWKHCTKVEI
jgi:hypothetical protein